MEKTLTDDDDGDGKSEKTIQKFKFVSSNGLLIQSEEDGKIKCGKCKKNFLRIISHLKNACKGEIVEAELEQLKQMLDNFHKAESQTKWEKKRKLETPNRLKASKKTRQNKWKEKSLSETPTKFKERKRYTKTDGN